MQVLTMIVSEYVLLMMPERFWLWYSVMVPVLLLMRYPDYRQRKWLLFYFDFCYYVQVCNSRRLADSVDVDRPLRDLWLQQ